MADSRCPDDNPACDGSDLLHGEWCKPLTRESGLALIEDAKRWQRAYERERDENARLRALVVEHHSVRAAFVGDICPICSDARAALARLAAARDTLLGELHVEALYEDQWRSRAPSTARRDELAEDYADWPDGGEQRP